MGSLEVYSIVGIQFSSLNFIKKLTDLKLLSENYIDLFGDKIHNEMWQHFKLKGNLSIYRVPHDISDKESKDEKLMIGRVIATVETYNEDTIEKVKNCNYPIDKLIKIFSDVYSDFTKNGFTEFKKSDINLYLLPDHCKCCKY
jgi:hypothetical protein